MTVQVTVMDALDRLREDVLGLDTGLTVRLAAELPPALRTALAEQRRRLAEGRYRVVVCGEFRRGKSSLLNALVDRPGLFPVDLDITTSVVTTLAWADKEGALVHLVRDPDSPGTGRPPLEVGLDQVARYVTEQGNPGNAEQVELVEMAAPLERLRSGLVLVDTPGAGGVNPAHSAATWAFMGRADAVLFVASAVEPLGTPELDLLTRALAVCPTVVTAVTMTDKVVDPAPVLDAARARIAVRTGRASDELVVVGVSTLRRRNAVRADDQQLLEASGFPALEREVWGGLAATCGVLRIQASLDLAEQVLETLAAPKENELAGLLDGSTLDALDAELADRRDELQKLRSSQHRWRGDIAADLETARRPVRKQLNDDLDGVRSRFRAALDTETSFADPDSLVRQVSVGLVEAAEDANRALAAAADRVAATYTALTTCALTGTGPAATSVGGTERSDSQIVVHGGPSRFTGVRNSWFGSLIGTTAGGWIGKVVGTLVLPGIGTVIGGALGGLVGLVFGVKEGRKETVRIGAEHRRREHVLALRDQVLPMIDAARRLAEQDLADQVRDQTRSLVDALDQHLTVQADSLSRSLAALASARKTTARERPARIASLTAELGRYAALQADVDELRGRADDLADLADLAGV